MGDSDPPWSRLPPNSISAEIEFDGKRVRLDDPEKKFYRFGRLATSCDIQIEHQTASRIHAIIAHHQDGGLCIVDLNSANGTFLDDEQLPPKEPTQLKNGSAIRFGEYDVVFRMHLGDKRQGAKEEMMSSLAAYGESEPDTLSSTSKDRGREGSRQDRRRSPERDRARERDWERGRDRDRDRETETETETTETERERG